MRTTYKWAVFFSLFVFVFPINYQLLTVELQC